MVFVEYFAEGTRVALGSGTVAGTPGTWTEAGCIVDATPPNKTAQFRDVNPCLNNPDRKVKKRFTRVDQGSFAMTIRFDADIYEDIDERLQEGETLPVAMILGDTGKAQIATCYVESLGVPQLSDEGEVQITASFIVVDDFAQVAASSITIAS